MAPRLDLARLESRADAEFNQQLHKLLAIVDIVLILVAQFLLSFICDFCGYIRGSPLLHDITVPNLKLFKNG